MNCQNCGTPLPANRRKWCSGSCQAAAWMKAHRHNQTQARPDRYCLECGVLLPKKNTKKLYCSQKCLNKSIVRTSQPGDRHNPDNQREYMRQYMKTEKGKARQLKHDERRRTRKAGAPTTFTAADWQAALEYFDYKCAYCGDPLTKAHLPYVQQ